jgi:hypothetical protein
MKHNHYHTYNDDLRQDVENIVTTYTDDVITVETDFEGETLLEPIIDEEYVEFTVPYLEVYDVIVIKEQSDIKAFMSRVRKAQQNSW